MFGWFQMILITLDGLNVVRLGTSSEPRVQIVKFAGDAFFIISGFSQIGNLH